MPSLQQLFVVVIASAASAGSIPKIQAEIRELASIEGVSDGFESSATGGNIFSMTKVREYEGPRWNVDDTPAPFPPPGEPLCERWAVLTSIFEPTNTVKQLAALDDWCVVVVGDENGPAEYDVPGVTYLTPADQRALPYGIINLLPWNHFGRKNVGYLYAVHHGAKVVYDVDDDNALIRPDEGLPHVDSTRVKALRFSGDGSSEVHNPYPCFGGPGNVWPRGFPLDAINDEKSTLCDVVAAGQITAERLEESRPLGVVQALANHDPDVDAIYRLTFPADGLPFNFDDAPSPEEENPLRVIPDSSFTPYNAQATLHFEIAFWGMLLPATVHGRVSDIWRSYFTQTLLPSVGAVAAFSPPWVAQARNPHNYLGDFQAELPLYERSGALVSFLTKYRRTVVNEMAVGAQATSLPERIDALAVAMYEYGIIEEADVKLSSAWLRDLTAAGYVPSAYSTERPSDLPTQRIGAGETVLGSDAEESHVVLAIAIVSIRPDRREAIRNSWLAWQDGRVVVRFFTELPDETTEGSEEAAAALAEESDTFGDIVLLDIERGMNFAVKLVSAFRWMSDRYSFDYFLRLDDDYFLCLHRLLGELEVTRSLQYIPPLMYAGHQYCKHGGSHMDEAYLLFSRRLVDRVLGVPNLTCGSRAGVTTGRWFHEGGQANADSDVAWVDDPRLDHTGGTWRNKDKQDEAHRSAYSDVCRKHMGVHHTYPEDMGFLWISVSDNGGHDGPDVASAQDLLDYSQPNKCASLSQRVADGAFENNGAQPCDSFKSNGEVHCGAEGCSTLQRGWGV